MSDCCVSPPSIGTWKIYVRVPIYYPNKIEYNWNDGLGTHTIEGDNYQISESIPDNTACSVTIRTYQTSGNNIFNQSTATYSSLCPATLYFDTSNPNYTYLYLIGGSQGQNVRYIGSFYTGSYGMGAEILAVSPTNPNTPKNYRLQIYSNNNIVYDETKQTQPTAKKIPEYCLQAEQRTYVRDYENFKQSDYCVSTIQGNQTTFYVNSKQANGTYVGLVLAYQASDERCQIAPIFEVDCISCKTCPEGTCTITCGDTICCYNSEGIAVDSFPIGELCL